MKRKFLIFSVFWLVFGGPTIDTVRATTVRTVNLEDMVRFADRIFWGRCVAVENGGSSENGMTVRHYRFRVVEGLKGVETGFHSGRF